MTPDTSDHAHDRSTGKKTFRPHVDDYIRRHVRRDHAPNAALHATLRALAESDDSRITNVNLMASHAPGEKDHEPDYDVVVDIENGGAGSASTFGTVISKLVQYNDVVITDAQAASIPTESDSHPGDTDYAIDRLTLHLRPVETRVEPVEVDYRHIPDDAKGINERTVAAVLGDVDTRLNEELRSVSPLRIFRDVVRDYDHELPEPDRDGADDRLQPLDVRLEDFPDGWRDKEIGPSYLPGTYDFDTIRRNVEMVLDHAIDHSGSTPETYEAARCFATFLYLIDPDTSDRTLEAGEDPLQWIRNLTDATDAEWVLPDEDDDPAYTEFPPGSHMHYHSVTWRTDDGKRGDVSVGDIDDAEDAVAAARAILDTFDVSHPVEPSDYAPGDDGRRGVPYDAEADADGDSAGGDRNAVTGVCADCGTGHNLDFDRVVSPTCACGGAIFELTDHDDVPDADGDSTGGDRNAATGKCANSTGFDRDSLTKSGRLNVPPAPDGRVSLEDISVPVLGSCIVDGGWSVECTAQASPSCPYGNTDLDSYNISMLAVYPECEACGAYLAIAPPEGGTDE